MQLSNKTLVYLILIAIVVTLVGTMVNLSRLGGLQQQITGLIGGAVNITVNATAAINLTQGVINWGSGNVNEGVNATLDTNNDTAYSVRGTWSSAGIRPFILQNIGNTPVNVSINSTTNATAYIGGSGPAFRYFGQNAAGNTTACESGLANQTDFNPSGNASQKQPLCNVFNFTNQRDHLWININITIPENAPTGSKNTTIVFIACDVSSGSCAA